MRHAAQQFRLRAAALEAARPQPDMVAVDLRHPAQPDAVQDHQRPTVDTVHQDLPAPCLHVDLPQPAAPGRLAAVLAAARKIGGYRMAVPGFRDDGLVAALDHLAGRLTRQGGAQRRAVDAVGAGEGRANGLQQCTARQHVIDDVLQIDRRQHAAPAIAVENHQVEFVQLDLEQLTRRE